MDIEVARDDLHRTRVTDADPAQLTDGQARLAVQRFGFSANNITYAVFGDLMGYWSFFPAEEGWGRIPVWGFAEVVEANGTGLTEGELLYGYLPMGSELVVRPVRVSDRGFTDATAHRAVLPAAYNGYTRCATDPVYEPDTEAVQLLFRPLFMTDFLLDDWLDDNDDFGAEVLVVSSASSKTAFGLAHLLARRNDGPEVIGLTSPGNVDFTAGLDLYDQVLTYDDLASLPDTAAAVYVDIAGDADVRRGVHERMGALTASVQVGGTHWEQVGGGGGLPGPTPALFFAPDQIVKRRADWGPDGIDARFGEAWQAFLPLVQDGIRVQERSGADAVVATYEEILDGRVDPADAFVLTLG
jgi:hypothetical protein